MSSTKWLPFCLGLNVLTAPESWVSTSWQLAHLLCLWRLYTSVNFHFFPNAASQRSVLASYMLHSSETSLITRSMAPWPQELCFLGLLRLRSFVGKIHHNSWNTDRAKTHFGAGQSAHSTQVHVSIPWKRIILNRGTKFPLIGRKYYRGSYVEIRWFTKTVKVCTRAVSCAVCPESVWLATFLLVTFQQGLVRWPWRDITT